MGVTAKRWVMIGALGALLLAHASCGARSELDMPAADSCLEFEARAEPSQLDVFLLLDSSGSMSFVTAQGGTKWDAIVTSFETFLRDETLEGSEIGVGFLAALASISSRRPRPTAPWRASRCVRPLARSFPTSRRRSTFSCRAASRRY